MIGPSDIPTEDKTITVCYGKDMTNIDFVNFVCASREVARVCPNPGNNPSNSLFILSLIKFHSDFAET